MMQDKDKIAEYDRLAAENSELKSELENLRKQIACLKKAVYGPKSEKTEVILKDSQQMPLEGVFNEAETEEHKEESVTVPEHKRKKKRSREESSEIFRPRKLFIMLRTEAATFAAVK